MDTKNCRVAVQEIVKRLRHLPELLETIHAIENKNLAIEIFGRDSIEYISKWYAAYIDVIKDISAIQSSDINHIHDAHTKFKLLDNAQGSAAPGGVDYFVKMLGLRGQKKLPAAFIDGANPRSPIFFEALKDLSDRMTEGHELASKGIELYDGASSEADYAIWGYTKGLQPVAMVHFVMCHFLERIFTAQYSNDADLKVREMVKQKDTLLAAMTDVILLRYTQYQRNADMITLWTTTRKDGGLEWMDSDQVRPYRQLLR